MKLTIRAVAAVVFASSVFLPLAVVAAAQSAVPTTATTGKVPPVRTPPLIQEIAALPDFSRPALSSNGQWIASFGAVDGFRSLMVRSTGRHSAGNAVKKLPPFVLANKTWTMRRFEWLPDDRLLLSVALPQSVRGVPIMVTRLLVVDPVAQTALRLFEKDTTRANMQVQDHVVSVLQHKPDQILVQMNPVTSSAAQVRSVNLTTGRLDKKVVQRARKGVTEWWADAAGEVRVGYGMTRSEKKAVLEIKDENGKWRSFPKLANNAGFSVVALPVGRPDMVYVLSDHEHNLGALYEFFVETGRFGVKLAQHDESEIADVYMDATGEHIESIGFHSELVADRYETPRLAELQSALDKRLKNTTNAIVSWTDDMNMLLVRSFASDVDPHYYLYQKATGSIDFLTSEYADLQQRQLAKTELAHYLARDGLKIPAYLTLPVTQMSPDSEQTRRPFILLPHGGPHARDFLRFDWLVQLLVSRGFGVLQMNYRGSTGYGRAFLEAGFKGWGEAMQDDITDGARWLVEDGLADEKRLCILGGSFGGYAALMGAAKTPDLYQAAVSLNGVSDLVDLLRENTAYQGGSFSTRWIGNLWTDRRLLVNNSPARRHKDIRIPVLLIHGENDRVVAASQSKKMHRLLLASEGERRAPVNYVVLDDGDHHLSRGANRLRFANETVNFLERYCD